MSLQTLEQFIPEKAKTHLRKWVEKHSIHFIITRNRSSKLGDYRKLPNGRHQITINGTLQPDLFFLVLTHELAHLKTREAFGIEVLPHGTEWKTIYRLMLIESLEAYADELQPLIFKFSKSPKANFMASTDLVYYFHKDKLKNEEVFLVDLVANCRFIYRNQKFEIIGRRKKNYLCKNLDNGKTYIFQPLASVQKI